MKKVDSKIAFGGGCHWCTEAIFQSIPAVNKVEQGWIRSEPPHHEFSEAIIVYFNEAVISLAKLISIHINTHSATSNHSMRSKYRSAIYFFNENQKEQFSEVMKRIQSESNELIITEILPFSEFMLNQENYLNYYYSNPEKPFCQTYIKPKLERLKKALNIM
ncbi:peptide-methionine (S)-S-oxide reductase [Marivirga sp.]|uniref:peptide-methionine (S)-S-oxide reductase n=1 Tax=Marivirga sp. TaxID=2018662 RepID=UPI0025D473C8|nr:peptide-methionine (S)-S-oxide reductase [Marivirga sp.]